MREQLVERFGLNSEDNADIAAMLSQQDSDTLMNLVEEFGEEDINIELNGDESRQCMVMSYALASALEEDRDSITAEDLENAQNEFSADLGEAEQSDESEDEQSDEAEASESETDDGPNLPKTVYNMVEKNHDAQKSEIVDAVLALPNFQDRKEGTIAVHYYNARKELGLETIGQRGRPSGSGKLPLMVDKMLSNPNMTRAEVIEWSMNELELAETTASNYYSTARKQVEGE